MEKIKILFSAPVINEASETISHQFEPENI